MKTLKILLILVLISSCNSTRVTFDYDETKDFTLYKSYSFYPELNLGLNPFDEERLLNSVKAGMKEENFVMTSTPDMFVNIFTEQFREESRNSIGVGVGGGGGNMGVGVSGGFPIGGPDTILRVIIDFIDAKNDALIWQAVVESKFDNNTSPQNQEAQFNKIVREALEKYPPKN